jgi:hypothetical protein
MEIVNPDWPPLAPLFHYHVTRFLNHGADPGGRLYLTDAIETLKRQGICREIDHSHPFTHASARATPTAAAFADGISRCIRLENFFFAYERIAGPSRVSAIRQHLRQGHAVVLGFTLPTGYENDTFLNAKFEWLNPDVPAPSGVGHCVLVIGFDDLRNVLHIQDSQGTARFDRGRWWMGYRIADGLPVTDAYAFT